MVVKVFLWTAPRCVSTAFERSIMEVKHSKIFHEPYAGSYHFGPERQSPRYLDQPVDPTVSYAGIEKQLSKEYDVDVIFSKDMAYAVEENFHRLFTKELQDFQHTFLIRNPRQAIPSLYKASVNKALTGWETFDPHESGFKQMYELYTYLEKRVDYEIVVVDAGDLLMDPEGTMKAYTEATGIPYDPSMLSWQPGTSIDWEVWNGWHDNVLKSTGFTKLTPEQANKHDDINTLPEVVQQSVNESMPYYMHLWKKKINSASSSSSAETTS